MSMLLISVDSSACQFHLEIRWSTHLAAREGSGGADQKGPHHGVSVLLQLLGQPFARRVLQISDLN